MAVHWRAVRLTRSFEARTTAVPRLFALMLALAAMCWPLSASAYYLPLVFAPGAPTTGQSITMTVRVGQCDAVQIFTPQDRELVIVGNVIRVTINGDTAFDQNFCIFPDVSAPVNLVPLAAGAYRVELYRRQIGMPTQVDLMVFGDLVVGQASSVSLPGLRSPLALTLLALGVIAIGLTKFRH